MKTIFTFLFLLPVVCFAQKKGDSKVIVSVSDTAAIFNRVALFLVDRGYVLDQKDKELGYVATEPKKLTKWRPEMSVKVIVRGTQLVITGKQRIDRDFIDVTYTTKANVMIYCWNELVDIGKQFGGVSFAK